MIPLIDTLEINLWLKLLIDATMKSFAIFAVAGLLGFIPRRQPAAVCSVLRFAVVMVRRSKIGEQFRTILAESRNRMPMTKVAAVIGLLALICLAMPIGVVQLAEAADSEQALYQEIQAVYKFQPDPLPENPTEAERAARREQYQQKWERGLQLCQQFLNTYAESERYDEVLYKKLVYIRNLKSASGKATEKKRGHCFR